MGDIERSTDESEIRLMSKLDKVLVMPPDLRECNCGWVTDKIEICSACGKWMCEKCKHLHGKLTSDLCWKPGKNGFVKDAYEERKADEKSHDWAAYGRFLDKKDFDYWFEKDW